jgi:hypothetical protein
MVFSCLMRGQQVEAERCGRLLKLAFAGKLSAR